jgi:hypothetical protein
MRQPHYGGDIQYQSDTAVAHHRRTRRNINLFQELSQRLNHRLMGAQDAVH